MLQGCMTEGGGPITDSYVVADKIATSLALALHGSHVTQAMPGLLRLR